MTRKQRLRSRYLLGLSDRSASQAGLGYLKGRSPEQVRTSFGHPLFFSVPILVRFLLNGESSNPVFWLRKNSRGRRRCAVEDYRENRALAGFALHVYGSLHGLHLRFYQVQPQSPAFRGTAQPAVHIEDLFLPFLGKRHALTVISVSYTHLTLPTILRVYISV